MLEGEDSKGQTVTLVRQWIQIHWLGQNATPQNKKVQVMQRYHEEKSARSKGARLSPPLGWCSQDLVADGNP